MKSLQVMLGLSACLLSLAAIAFAQDKAPATAPAPDAKAAVTGTVSDETGTGVGGAVVTMDNGAGQSTSATTDGQGLYAITDLAPGSYTISVVLRGARIFQANVVLSPGQILTMSVAGAPVAQPGPKAPSPTPAAPPPAPGAATPAPAGNTSAPSPQTQPSGAVPPPSTANPAATLPAPALPAPVVPNPSPSAVVPAAPAPEQTTAPAAPQIISAPGGFTGPGIGGAVTDQTGAVLVGATVKVSNATGVVQTVVSDDKGNYAVRGLPPGSYNITVTMKGFKPFEANGLPLAAGESLPLDAGLEPAGEQTEVNVSGQTVSQVETETAQVSGTITEKEVLNLGLNGRNFTQLIALTPGVSNQTGQDEAHVGVTGSVKYSVNGGRVEYNTFEVDGGDVLNAGLNGAESTLIVYPSLDAIQEVKVLTSNYGAQYGRTASGTVIVSTKSGGAQYHGDGYEFFRNEALNARNYFDQTTKAPLYRRNDFGFTFGGPVFIPSIYTKKDKTFFFWSEEFRFEKSPTDQQPDFNRAVPSLAERKGDFSDVCPFYTNGFFFRNQWPDCPSTGVNGSNILAQTAFFNNQVTLDPNALALLNTNLIPLPNSATGCNSPIGSCYDAVISEPTRWREELGRIDHDFNPKIRLSLRFIHDAWNTVVPIPEWQHLPSNTLNSFPTVQNKFDGPGVSVVARLTQTINPTFLNEFSASFANSHITLTNVDGPGGANYLRPAGLGEPGGACTTVCPLGALFNNGFEGKAPSIVIGGNNQEYGGNGFTVDTSYMPWEHTNPTYSLRDDLSKVIKRHTLQFGVQGIIAQKNETNDASGAATGDVQGLLTFSNINGGVNSTGNAFANFLALLGSGDNPIQSYTQDSAQSRYHNRYLIGEPFVQDDWKLNSRLTLNLGVRFSLFGLYHEKYLREYNWDPAAFSPALASQVSVNPTNGQLLSASTQTPIPIDLSNPDPRILNGLVHCGVSGVPAGCMKGHLFNPAPRIGVAWDPRGDGKMSIRAGYGIFYEHGTGEESNTGSLEASAPYVLNMTQSFPQNYGCIGGAPATGTCFAPPGAYPLNVVAIPTTAVWPYSQQWSLSVQRELPKSMVATIGYVGSKGTHLTVERQLNQLQPLPAALNPFGAQQPLIPEPSTAGAGDCNGFTGHQFQLNNGTTVGPQDPAFINLEAACFGQPPSFAHVGEFPPVPYVNTLRPYPG
ncbi:MAG: carboxypeptidase regulatory-like domain-containing protein, partial [Candidatus Sulfotelmatobacter sp.]